MDRSAYDVVVAGAGLAGSAAAARAADLGCRVLLADAAEDPSAGGNSAMSWGSLHVATIPLTSPAAVIRKRIDKVTGGKARPELADALAANAGRALAWLLWNGVQVVPPKPADSWKTTLAPERGYDDGAHTWAGRGPQMTLQRLQESIRERGGHVRGGTRIREIVRAADGSVTAAVTASGERIATSAVVLADGGFASNAELRKRYLGPAADLLFMRGSASNQGDALRIGEAAGAKLVNISAFYGRCLHRDALTNDRLWPMPFLDDLLVLGIVADKQGSRLVDEGRGGIVASNALGRSRDPLGAFVILDERGWATAYDRAGYSGSGGVDQPPANPEVERRGGVIHRSATIRGLAASTGIDPDGLERTLREYGVAVASGTTERLAIPRTGKIAEVDGPYLALPLLPSITFTMGGLLTDADARVLDAAEHPITGLYAVGGCAGGLQGSLEGGTAASYVGGLATGLVAGMLAGEAIVAARDARGGRGSA